MTGVSKAPGLAPHAGSTPTVLAVDDIPANLELLTSMLDEEGYRVLAAHNGAEALSVALQAEPDLILLDVNLPDLDGYEVCRRLKQEPRLSEVPVLFVSAMRDPKDKLKAFAAGGVDYVTKPFHLDEVRARISTQIALRTTRLELQRANHELEAFSYSVSHDLRAPLRSIDGFSQALVEDHGPALGESGNRYLRFIRDAAHQMDQMIGDMLMLARASKQELQRELVDISQLARELVARLTEADHERRIDWRIQDGMTAECSRPLTTVVLQNLLGNAIKFTAKKPAACIEVATTEQRGRTAFLVRDNGAGFDMTYADRLFGLFQRLHGSHEFEGTGVGLATVNRIIRRHGGHVWAEGEVDRGATFYFTLA